MKGYIGPEYDVTGLEQARETIKQTMAEFPERPGDNAEGLYHTLDLISDQEAERDLHHRPCTTSGPASRSRPSTSSAWSMAKWPKSKWADEAKKEMAKIAKAPRKASLPSKIMTLPGAPDPNAMGCSGGGIGGMRRRDGRRWAAWAAAWAAMGGGMGGLTDRPADPARSIGRVRTEEGPSMRSVRRLPDPTARPGPRAGRWPLLAPGCKVTGYSIRPPYDTRIKTVYVPVFKSITFRRDVNLMLTELVIKEIERRTPYKVVGKPEEADTTLEGTINFSDKNMIVENPFNLPRQLTSTMIVDVTWTDNQAEEKKDPEPGRDLPRRSTSTPRSARPRRPPSTGPARSWPPRSST